MISELEKEFVGTGEVSGVSFKQIDSNEGAFLYSRYEDGVMYPMKFLFEN